MHELSIVMSLIDVVREESTARQLSKIRRVHLKLGALSGVVKTALLSAYDIAREGTVLASAELVIEEAPIVIFCPSCSGESTADSAQFLCCCRCGTFAGKVISGREMELTALEVEQ
jgi:hydrogenase nickel incorporation protein HypA/HybF